MKSRGEALYENIPNDEGSLLAESGDMSLEQYRSTQEIRPSDANFPFGRIPSRGETAMLLFNTKMIGRTRLQVGKLIGAGTYVWRMTEINVEKDVDKRSV